MAVNVVNGQPYVKEYVQSPFYYLISSTTVNYLDFKYHVYVTASYTGSTDDIHFGDFVFAPRPETNNYGYFNPSSVLRGSMRFDLTPTITEPVPAIHGALIYNLYLGEEYDSSPILSAATGTTIYTGLTTWTGYYALNAVRQYEQANILDQYDPESNPGQAKLLSDWNSIYYKRIRENEFETMTFFNSNPYVFDTYDILTFDISGNPIGHYQIEVDNISQMRYDIPTGTRNLTQTATNLLTSSTDYIINSGVSSYQILCFTDGGTTQLTTEYYYQIDRSCKLYDGYRLAWKGSLGGNEYFSMDVLARKSIDVKRYEWEKKLNYNYSVGDRGRTAMYPDAKTKLAIVTDWISEIEGNYLNNSLFTSSEVFIIDANGNKLPVLLTDTNAEQKTIEQDRLISYTFNLEYSYGIGTHVG